MTLNCSEVDNTYEGELSRAPACFVGVAKFGSLHNWKKALVCSAKTRQGTQRNHAIIDLETHSEQEHLANLFK